MSRPRVLLVRALAVLLPAALLVGCSDGDDDRPADPRESPESATEALMVLWQARDREAADRLGGDAVMDSLFGVTPPKQPLEVVECLDEPEIPGAKTCSARGGAATVLVTLRKEDVGWQVIAALPIR